MPATAHASFRDHWRELRRGRPGRRFQERYERARQGERRHGPTHRILMIGGAVVSLMIAAVLTVFPGPAILFFFIAGGLLATESRAVARFMDWCELKLRAVVQWAKRLWRARRRA